MYCSVNWDSKFERYPAALSVNWIDQVSFMQKIETTQMKQLKVTLTANEEICFT